MPTDDRVERYAPLLRFSTQDTNFPIDPALFVARSRLRRFGWARSSPDGFWNPKVVGWDGGHDLTPPAHASAPDLSKACALMQSEAPGRPGAGRNRRPNDPLNLWDGRRAGYGLELTQAFARELRGVAGSAPFLLYDRYRVSDAAEPCDVITYWCFYSLHVDARPHEGDWCPISVLLPLEGSDDQPRVRYPGAGGVALHAFNEVEWADGTHPVACIEPGSHGAYRCSAEMGEGAGPQRLVLRSWKLALKPIQELPWSCFDGAWGRVGSTDATTGPLGPMLRRLDAAALVSEDARRGVVQPA